MDGTCHGIHTPPSLLNSLPGKCGLGWSGWQTWHVTGVHVKVSDRLILIFDDEFSRRSGFLNGLIGGK